MPPESRPAASMARLRILSALLVGLMLTSGLIGLWPFTALRGGLDAIGRPLAAGIGALDGGRLRKDYLDRLGFCRFDYRFSCLVHPSVHASCRELAKLGDLAREVEWREQAKDRATKAVVTSTIGGNNPLAVGASSLQRAGYREYQVLWGAPPGRICQEFLREGPDAHPPWWPLARSWRSLGLMDDGSQPVQTFHGPSDALLLLKRPELASQAFGIPSAARFAIGRAIDKSAMALPVLAAALLLSLWVAARRAPVESLWLKILALPVVTLGLAACIVGLMRILMFLAHELTHLLPLGVAALLAAVLTAYAAIEGHYLWLEVWRRRPEAKASAP
jgi:hypothetical protein